MSAEGMQATGSEQVPLHVEKEGAQKRAVDRNHFESARLESLGQELRELGQRQRAAAADLLQYEAVLTEGGKHMYQGSEELKQLALKLDTETREKRDARREEKKGIEKALEEVRSQIIKAGGNPGDYTLQ